MRSLSSAAKSGIFAQTTDRCFLTLLTLTHASFSTNPLRFVNDYAAIVSSGRTFNPLPFEVTLADETSEKPPEVRLVMDNVAQAVIAEMRSITTPVEAQLEVVLLESPNTIEAGPFLFQIREFGYDAYRISAKLAFEPVLDEPFPKGRFSPSEFPALF